MKQYIFLLVHSKESRSGHRHAPRTVLTSGPELGKSSGSLRFTAILNNESTGYLTKEYIRASFTIVKKMDLGLCIFLKLLD